MSPQVLNGTHYDQVNQGLRHLNDALEVIQRAQASGMDTRAHSELHRVLTDRLTAIKNQFFPTGRPK